MICFLLLSAALCANTSTLSLWLPSSATRSENNPWTLAQPLSLPTSISTPLYSYGTYDSWSTLCDCTETTASPTWPALFPTGSTSNAHTSNVSPSSFFSSIVEAGESIVSSAAEFTLTTDAPTSWPALFPSDSNAHTSNVAPSSFVSPTVGPEDNTVPEFPVTTARPTSWLAVSTTDATATDTHTSNLAPSSIVSRIVETGESIVPSVPEFTLTTDAPTSWPLFTTSDSTDAYTVAPSHSSFVSPIVEAESTAPSVLEFTVTDSSSASTSWDSSLTSVTPIFIWSTTLPTSVWATNTSEWSSTDSFAPVTSALPTSTQLDGASSALADEASPLETDSGDSVTTVFSTTTVMLQPIYRTTQVLSEHTSLEASAESEYSSNLNVLPDITSAIPSIPLTSLWPSPTTITDTVVTTQNVTQVYTLFDSITIDRTIFNTVTVNFPTSTSPPSSLTVSTEASTSSTPTVTVSPSSLLNTTVYVTVTSTVTTRACSTQTQDPQDLEPVLAFHNAVRANYSAQPLEWNNTLAVYAQNYVLSKNCVFEHSGGPYGENLALAGSALDGASMWANEAKDYDYRNPQFSESTGHFTQMVWANTTQLGCGTAMCDNSVYLVCEYYPRGNMAGEYEDNVLPKSS